ncbi:MAG: GNAT family N-acetyltransferase [Gemmatimonadaceae bacterium]|nr:GNAT family N-acetyltransferase [Gemmatimonadaceae bacterium]
MRSIASIPSSGVVASEVVVRLLGAHEATVLAYVAPQVFDEPVNGAWCTEFLADSRHHLAVALHGPLVVGMASAVHYLHPDKPNEMLINEAGVSESYRDLGIGRRLLAALLAHATLLGCEGAWVLTEASNAAARRMYAAAGGIEKQDAPVMIEFRT